MTMQLCGVSVSPYFERILTMLDLKGAMKQLEYPGVPGGFKSAEHLAHHPMGMVPYLIKDDGDSLTEGQIIMEYLDAVLDGPKMLPDSPDAAAQVKAICRIFDLYYYAAQRPIGSTFFGGEEDPDAIKKALEEDIPKALNYIEKYMGEASRAVGDSWSIADTVLISQFYWYDRVGAKFPLPTLADYPKLNSYWVRTKETDEAKRSFARIEKSFEEVFGSEG